MAVSDELTKFIDEITFEEIPKETVEYTKHLALKEAAGSVVGSEQESGQRMIDFVSKQPTGREEAGVIAGNFKTDLIEATIANATTTHASELENDKMRPGEDMAWTCTVFPVTFTMAEKYGLSGKEFIEASAVGLEVQNRLSLVPNHWNRPIPGLQAASAGVAAAASKAMDLEPEEINNALGIAIGGGFIFAPHVGTDAHFLDSAFQCVRGLKSAIYAKEGFDANTDFEKLFWGLYRGDSTDPKEVVEGLNEEWLLHKISIKKYPTCFVIQRQIDVLREIVEEYDLDEEDVKEVHIEIGTFEDQLCNLPTPKNVNEAKFSYQYLLGATLIDRDVNFSHLTEEKLFDPEYERASEKITVEMRPEWDEPFMAPATVEVTLNNEKVIEQERQYMKGSRQDPLSGEEVQDLYAKFSKGILSDSRIERTSNMIMNIESEDRVEELMELLTFPEREISAAGKSTV